MMHPQVRAQFESWSKQHDRWHTFQAAQSIEALEATLLTEATTLVQAAKVCVCLCI